MNIASTFVYTPFEEIQRKAETEINVEALSNQPTMKFGRQGSEVVRVTTKKSGELQSQLTKKPRVVSQVKSKSRIQTDQGTSSASSGKTKKRVIIEDDDHKNAEFEIFAPV